MSNRVLDRMTSDMDKAKRELSPDISVATGNAEILWQVKSYWIIFKSGSPPLILGKTSTSRGNHGTVRLGRGSSRATQSQNGKILDQVRSYGSMGNVSYRLAFTFSKRLMSPLTLAGAGKSVLWSVKPSTFFVVRTHNLVSSAIIEEVKAMQRSGPTSLAIFYYDFREDGKRHVLGLLSSVLFQLSDQSDSYYDIMSACYSAHRNGAQSPSDDELVQCLMDLLKRAGPRPVYLVIDALDECPSTSSLSSPREKLLSLLEDLVEAQIPNLRICVTSRPEVDIKAILEPLAFRSVSLHDESGQKQDIKKYIQSIVTTNKNMQNWNPEHKQLVIDVLTRKADGM